VLKYINKQSNTKPKMQNNRYISKRIIKTGIILSMLGVAFGAFGAHALSDILEENSRVDTFDTGVLYLFVHSIAIITTRLIADKYDCNNLTQVFYLFLGGIIFFSGSLFILSLTDIRMFGAITPIGGGAFIFGWIRLYFEVKNSD